MGLGTRCLAAPQDSLAAASVVAGYTAIGTPLTKPALAVLFVNATDQDVQISLDGTHDHFPLLARSSFIFDVSSDKVVDRGLFIAQGTQVYAKRIGTPTTGSVYVSYFYSLEAPTTGF